FSSRRRHTRFSRDWSSDACSSDLATAPATTQQAPATNYSDAQLEKFVSASQKVAVISQEYTPKLQSTTDETTRQRVYQEADEKIDRKSVRREGREKRSVERTVDR